jgi:long-chain acyl-CoA synthetase
MKKLSDIQTLSHLIFYQGKKFHHENALNFVENEKQISFSNQEFYNNALLFALGLKKLGLKKGDRIANISYQNPIWLICDFGSILSGGISVPIFENISNDHLQYEIEHSNSKIIFTDNQKTFNFIKKNFPDSKIITYGFRRKDHYNLDDILELGIEYFESKNFNEEKIINAAKPNDIAAIIYTSGSTGLPKGVEITHKNLISQIKATSKAFKLYKDQDQILSFLPLAHIFERMVVTFYISQGVSINFVDDVNNLGVFLKEVRPTLMTTVPRMLEKVYAKIFEGVDCSKGFKKFIGTKALKRALVKNPKDPLTIFDRVYGKLVYSKFLAALGSNMRMVICGGAPLSEDLEKFYQNIGINLFCGYGMTETSPVISANNMNANKIGTVGKAFDQVKVKIAKDSELLVSGPGVMKGYHKDKKRTAEIIKNGWLKTGDLAEIDRQGYIKIIGRKKEGFKSSNGKYINPVNIEQKLVQKISFLIGVVVIGEGRNFTSAIIFCDLDLLHKAKEKIGFIGRSGDILRSKILNDYISSKIDEVNKDLDNWEKIRKFHIAKEEISIESGEITPSMKIKRGKILEKYQKQIEGFYK